MNIILKLGNCNFNTHSISGINIYKFPPYTIISFEREDIFETRRNRQNFKQSLVKAAWERGVFVPNTNMCWLDASILYDFDTDAIVILRMIKNRAKLTIVNSEYISKPLIDRYVKKLIGLSGTGAEEAILITTELGMGRVVINQAVEVEDVQQYLSLALDQEGITF